MIYTLGLVDLGPGLHAGQNSRPPAPSNATPLKYINPQSPNTTQPPSVVLRGHLSTLLTQPRRNQSQPTKRSEIRKPPTLSLVNKNHVETVHGIRLQA
jgi:hypothetical protein